MKYKITKKPLDRVIELSNGMITNKGYYEVIVEYDSRFASRVFPNNISPQEERLFINLAKKKLHE
jgi:hypothetical protein